MTINALIVPSLDNYDSIDEWAEALVGSLTTLSEDALTEATTVFDTQGREIVGINGLHVYDGAGNPVVADDIVQINTAHLADAAITEPKIADASIGTAKIQNAAIVSALIGNLQVLTAHIDDLAVNEAKIANLAVTSAKIALLAVGNAQINDLDVGKLTAGTIAAALIMTGKLTLGSATFGSSGIQLEYNSGNPRLYAGDGGEKYLKFETSTGEVTIGRDTELAGADAYNNKAIYISGFAQDFYWAETASGSGTSITFTNGYIRLDVSTVSTTYVEVQKSHLYNVSDTSWTWAKDRRLLFRITAASTTLQTNRYFYLGWGSASGANARIMLFFDNGTIKGQVCNNTTCSTVTLTGAPHSGVWEIVFTAGVSAEFFVDGVSYGSVITNLPSASGNPHVLIAKLGNSGTTANATSVFLGEFKFLQEA